MSATFEYNNTARKIELTCDQTLDMASDQFQRFLTALDMLHGEQPIDTVGMTLSALDYLITVVTAGGLRLVITLRFIDPDYFASFTTDGTFWPPTGVQAESDLIFAIRDLISSQGMTALTVDYF